MRAVYRWYGGDTVRSPRLRPRHPKRVATLSAAFGGLAWAASCAVVYLRAFGHRRSDDFQMTPSDFGATYEALDVRTADGVRLTCWYLPGTRDAAVIVSGGYRGRASDVLGISAALQRDGFHVTVYGWRGTPGSDVAAHTLGVHERNDLQAAIEATVGRVGKVPIGLLGYSLGGSVSISVAADDPRIGAVVADSAFADPRALIGDRVSDVLRIPATVIVAPVLAVLGWRTGAHLSDFRPLNVVSRLAPRPLLLIHGDADTIVPIAHARMLYSAARRPKRIWTLRGVGHVGAYFADRTRYIERVVSFFEDALTVPAKEALEA